MRINLKKYGFEECKDENFSDDGNRFTIYRNLGCPDLRISKLVSGGQVYLAARMEAKEYNPNKERLSFEEYSKLEHFVDLDKLNGVDANYINEEVLASWIVGITNYYKEYNDKLNYLIENDMPKDEDLEKALKEYVQLSDRYSNKGEEVLGKLSSQIIHDSTISLYSGCSTSYQLTEFFHYARELIHTHETALKLLDDFKSGKIITRSRKKEILKNFNDYKKEEPFYLRYLKSYLK